MTDSSLPKSSFLHPQKIPYTRKDGSHGYVEGSICDHCNCNSKQQARCIFQRENALGIMAGFSPKASYRRKHRDDLNASPLMQSFRLKKPIDNGVAFDSMVLPEVKFPHFPVQSWDNMLKTMNKMKVIRRQVMG